MIPLEAAVEYMRRYGNSAPNKATATKAAAELARLRTIEAALKNAEVLLRRVSKAPTKNGWVMAAPQFFEEQADKLAAALGEEG